MEEERKTRFYVKNGFSHKNNMNNIYDYIQIDSLSSRTRNLIFDVIKLLDDILPYKVNKSNGTGGWYTSTIYDKRNEFIKYYYTELLSLTELDIPKSNSIYDDKYSDKMFLKSIKENIQQCEYNEVFDLIIGIYNFLLDKDKKTRINFVKNINIVFRKENVNYTLIEGSIVDIVNKEELKSLEDLINSKYNNVSGHISKAISLLYNKEKPDYENSIKESISAVEAMCQIITENDKATLGQALKILKKDIHPALNAAFDKLYGYTSDVGGIRHANGLGNEKSTFAEAKYMLLSCSAFVNYLLEESNK